LSNNDRHAIAPALSRRSVFSWTLRANVRATVFVIAQLAPFAATLHAQTVKTDLWQTYMDAALSSDQTNDFQTEAIILHAAFDYANQNDQNDQRPAMTRLPLMLAYIELGRKDLWDPLTKTGLNIDVGELDDRVGAFIFSIGNFGSSYDSRWQAHQNDKSTDDFLQNARMYGAKNSYKIEVALRTKLERGDEVGLALAMANVGLIYRHDIDYNCAIYDYDRGFQAFSDFQRKRDAVNRAGTLFDVEQTPALILDQNQSGQPITAQQVYIVILAGMELRDSAASLIHSTTNTPSPTNDELSTTCDSFGPPATTPAAVGFEAKVTRASQYFAAALKLTEQLQKDWPGNPIFDDIYLRIASLYQTEYEWRQTHPNEYPDALQKARNAYDKSLSNAAVSLGPKTDFVQGVASDYASFLLEAQQSADAKKIEAQYGVTARN
jgi:hypothetical protein